MSEDNKEPWSGAARELEQQNHDLRMRVLELETELREANERARLQDLRVDMLQERQTRFERLFDHAPVAQCRLNRDGRITHCNLALASFLGVGRRELIGELMAPLVMTADIGLLERHLQTCFNERRRVTTDLRLTLPHFGVVPFQLVTTPMTDVHGELDSCHTALIDLSQLKRAEERLALLSTASARLMSSFDLAGNVEACLKTLVPALADVCMADVQIDGRVSRLIAASEDTRPEVLAVLKRAPASVAPLDTPLMVGGGGGIDLTRTMAAGLDQRDAIRELDVRSLLALPITARSEHVGVLTFAMTVSDRRYAPIDFTFAQDLAMRLGVAVDNSRLYAHAQQAVKARQELLSIVSHDLRSPLSGILLSSDSLMQAAPPHERRAGRRHLVRIRRSVMQMRRLVDDLLDAASLEKGGLSILPQDVAVSKLLDEAREIFGPMVEDQGARLVCEGVEGLHAKCDRERVLQVLWNLVGNALRYAPEGSAIELSVGREGNEIRFAVRDHGPGLPAGLFPQLFEREPRERDRRRRGRGLGLYICKGIVDAHNGRIWAENAEGGGARFMFTLPEGVAEAEPSRRRVLIVEDDPSVREVVADLLNLNGWTVVQVANGSEALAYLETAEVPPNVVLLDLGLPVMDGRELMSALKERQALSRIPVLLLSSAERLDDEVKRLGAAGAIKKPPDLNALLAALASQAGPARA